MKLKDLKLSMLNDKPYAEVFANKKHPIIHLIFCQNCESVFGISDDAFPTYSILNVVGKFVCCKHQELDWLDKKELKK